MDTYLSEALAKLWVRHGSQKIFRHTNESLSTVAKGAGIHKGRLSDATNGKGTLSEGEIVKLCTHLKLRQDERNAIQRAAARDEASTNDEETVHALIEAGQRKLMSAQAMCSEEGRPLDAITITSNIIGAIEANQKIFDILRGERVERLLVLLRLTRTIACILTLPTDQLLSATEEDCKRIRERLDLLSLDREAYDMASILSARVLKILGRCDEAIRLFQESLPSIQTPTVKAECYRDLLISLAQKGDRRQYEQIKLKAEEEINNGIITAPVGKIIIYSGLAIAAAILGNINESQQHIRLMEDLYSRYEKRLFGNTVARLSYHHARILVTSRLSRDLKNSSDQILAIAEEAFSYIEDQFIRSCNYLREDLKKHPSPEVRSRAEQIMPPPTPPLFWDRIT